MIRHYDQPFVHEHVYSWFKGNPKIEDSYLNYKILDKIHIKEAKKFGLADDATIKHWLEVYIAVNNINDCYMIPDNVVNPTYIYILGK